MPSSKTPTDDIELSPGAANENDERFICGELKTEKDFLQLKKQSQNFTNLLLTHQTRVLFDVSTDRYSSTVAVFHFYISKEPQRKGFVLHNLKTFLFFPSKKKIIKGLKQLLATELI